MSLINIQNLTFSYPGSFDNIFDNVSFQIDSSWKLGFVGRNGRGKTTLFRLLMGEYEYSGRISAGVNFAYFPYPVKDADRLSIEVLYDVCPDGMQWQFEKELSLLEVEDDVLWRPFCTLSNGEQTKVLLAALFLNENSFLLIDEPTNHLDLYARQVLSAYLKRKSGYILVSHDRTFLDGCVDHILSINRADIQVQSGNFTTWFDQFNRRQESEMARNERLKKDISRLSEAARKTSEWSGRAEADKIGIHTFDRGYVGHKAAKLMKRSKSIARRRQQAIEEKESLLKNAEAADDLKISPLRYHADTLLEAKDLTLRYDGKAINSPLTFAVGRGEKVVLQGKNGSGKSSVIKLLLGDHIDHEGVFHVGSGLIISYVPQSAEHLSGSLKDFADSRQIDESLFLAILRKMDFSRVQFEKDMSDYSAGQKKKVLLAASLCQRAHLYVWDEPLNYIDIYSRMQIEQLIHRFAPTMLLVEHDAAFCQAVATKTVALQLDKEC